MEKVISIVMGILAIPIFLLNLFGGIVTGVILVFGGDWTPLLLGLLFMFVGVFIISILMLPSLAVGGLAIYFANRRNRFGVGLSVLASQVLIYAIMFGVSYSVFGVMLQFDDSANRLVLLIWSFAVAVAPWSYMASKEQNNEGTQLTLFASELGLLTVLILMGFYDMSLDESFSLIGTLTIFPILLTTFYAIYKIHNSGESLLLDGSQPKKSNFSQQELIAFVVCLLHIAKSDGVLHPDEIKHAKQSFQEITGERISRGFVEKIYYSLDTGTINYKSIIDEAEDSISEKMKHNIIKGAYSMAHADKKVRPEELKAIIDVGKELGVPNEKILKIIKS